MWYDAIMLSHITPETEQILKAVATGETEFDDVLYHPDGKFEEAASLELMHSLDDVFENHGLKESYDADKLEAREIVKSNIREAYGL